MKSAIQHRYLEERKEKTGCSDEVVLKTSQEYQKKYL